MITRRRRTIRGRAGAGRNVRFGDLDGKVLWQLGRPDRRNGLLTNDTPFQIHDLDGDGRNDVVLARDFKLQVLEGATGKLKAWAWLPPMSGDTRDPYQRQNGDSICFLDVSGAGARRDILLKDRYRRFWVFDNRLELRFSGETNTGHYPYPIDLDGDRRDEVLIGQLPVSWRGDGEEFALLSGSVREGGMIDGRLRRVVLFPDDGHPELAAHVLDLTGDTRDEVVLWDQDRVWIYTQDRPYPGERIYAPVRNPLYNDSNYRANVSLPGWRPMPVARPAR